MEPGTLDSMVEVGLDKEVRSGLGVEPIAVSTVKKQRSLMFSYQESVPVLEKEVADEALAILRQKDEQAQEELTTAAKNQDEKNEVAAAADIRAKEIQAEMEELNQKSKMESKVSAKVSAGKLNDNREVNDQLMKEWEKTAKSAGALIKQSFAKF